MSNVVAEFKNGSNKAYTKALHQYDRGMRLVFVGADLPESFDVHFSNDRESGFEVSCEGTSAGVIIPEKLLASGNYVYAWVHRSDEPNESFVEYSVVIPVIRHSSSGVLVIEKAFDD